VNTILGLTGPNASGKGEAAEYLESLGFAIHSLSDIVREEAKRLGRPPERAHLIEIGNALRRDGGAGVLAEMLVARLPEGSVVDSIRNPAEVAVLRRLPSFVLVGIRAPLELRWERSRARGRTGDAGTLEEFRAVERRENASDPASQQLDATMALADHRVDNDGSIEVLHQRLDEVLRACGGTPARAL
jgi:dephospho-CoA kinase